MNKECSCEGMHIFKNTGKIKSCRANNAPCPNYPARITIRITKM